MNAIHETCPLCGEYHQGTACHQQVGFPIYKGEGMNQNELIEEAREYIPQLRELGRRNRSWRGLINQMCYSFEAALTAPQPEASDREIATRLFNICVEASRQDVRKHFTSDEAINNILSAFSTLRADERRKILEEKGSR